MQNLSQIQKVRLLKLNHRLQKLQEKIIKEAIKLDIELSKRVNDKTDILDDYEIDVGTQRIWPPRALTLGQLTHNDLASVRIAKRATKSL